MFLYWLLCFPLLLLALPHDHWTPQLGTTKVPKLPALSPRMQKGDYYFIDGEYYRALTAANLDNDPNTHDKLPGTGDKTTYWQHFPRGTFIIPKTFGTHSFCEKGDIFYDEVNSMYYQAKTNGDIPLGWKEDLLQKGQSVCQWEILEANSNWMSLLRPIIGDSPLGDLILPGCHDAGTWGITEDSILVDKGFLLQLGDELTPKTVANWSRTHADNFDLQLNEGFRYLDLRVADVDEIEPGVFRWYHAMTADEITEGLQHIGQFARSHPEEVLILNMIHFAAPGNVVNATEEIKPARKDILSGLILQYLGDRMVYRGNLSSNPTMNEVLATGGNILVLMMDDYIRAKDDRYWELIIHSVWVPVANPEDLFNERSGKLENFHQFHNTELTGLSGCVTADERLVVAGLLTVYGDNETLSDIIEPILPGFLEIQPGNMSFEGLWVDLLNLADYGTNTFGMRVRDPDHYTNGASVHYSGTNDQLRHWVARPDKYKPNLVYTDGFLKSSFVTTAVEANRGDIPREVTIAHQGNPMNGYYIWDETDWSTLGGDAGLECTSVDVQYTIRDQGVLLDIGVISHIGLLDLQEGAYPPGADVEIDVSSVGDVWRPLWAANIQQMIDTNNDVYVRGTDISNSQGFAYLSVIYNDFGVDCNQPPSDNSSVLASVEW